MPRRPNILLLFTDQHRLSAVGAYGPTPCRTPNIDRLAAEGIRFDNAYTVCPVCSPARGTIMTGLYPHTHGICSNVHNLGCSIHELEDRPSLLSRRLQSADYQLGYTGKWHLGTEETSTFGGSNRPSLPRDVGFEGQNFPGHGGGGFEYPEYKAYLAERGLQHVVKPWSAPTRRAMPAGELAGPVESTVPYFLAQNTIDLIDRFRRDRDAAGADQPFFIWHNNWGPHTPYFAPTEYVDLYRDVPIPEWPNYRWPARATAGPHHAKLHPRQEILTWDDWQDAIRHYYAFTTLIDDQFGRIIAHLRAVGELDNTVIIFTADHGETLGSHGGLTDKGWHHFDETHRIPLIVRFPDGRFAGTSRDELMSLADIYPTILDLAGVAAADSLHGRSLVPLVEGRAPAWRDSVVTEFGGVNSVAATMRTIVHSGVKFGWGSGMIEELYDLRRDPHEMHNVIADPAYASVAEDLRRRLLAWMDETRDPARGIYAQQMSCHHPDLGKGHFSV